MGLSRKARSPIRSAVPLEHMETPNGMTSFVPVLSLAQMSGLIQYQQIWWKYPTGIRGLILSRCMRMFGFTKSAALAKKISNNLLKYSIVS